MALQVTLEFGGGLRPTRLLGGRGWKWEQVQEFFKANNAALKAANDAYAKTLTALAATT